MFSWKSTIPNEIITDILIIQEVLKRVNICMGYITEHTRIEYV
jgi:hypothetical protein